MKVCSLGKEVGVVFGVHFNLAYNKNCIARNIFHYK